MQVLYRGGCGQRGLQHNQERPGTTNRQGGISTTNRQGEISTTNRQWGMRYNHNWLFDHLKNGGYRIAAIIRAPYTCMSNWYMHVDQK